nr:10420_t:CDS:1 [Entrophospora candida]
MNSLTFIIKNRALLLLVSFLLFIYVLFNRGNVDIDEYDDINSDKVNTTKRRPNDNFIVKVEKIEKNCGNWKYIMVTDCLKYLDKHESDYLVPYNTIDGGLKPPSCICDVDVGDFVYDIGENTNVTEKDEGVIAEEPEQQNPLSPKIMIFHVYWKGIITDKLALMMKSFIYTQPLDCAKLYVWIEDLKENYKENANMKLLKKFIPKHIELRNWNTKEQLSSIDLFNGWDKIFAGEGTVSFSDLVRFALLYKYGGIYVDADVLLLRDMRPFYYSNFEFSYHWSYKDEYNTAILRLWKNSDTAALVIKGAMINDLDFHPYRIKNYLSGGKADDSMALKEANKKLYMLPVGLFDPLFLKHDLKQVDSILSPNLFSTSQMFEADLIENEFPDVNLTKPTSPLVLRNIDYFFRGAYAYHWHNHWEKEIPFSSWMGVIQTAYNQFMEGKRSNLYNELL